MKKILSKVLFVFVMVLSLTACSKKNDVGNMDTKLYVKELKEMANLVTLSCKFNNVAKLHQDKNEFWTKERDMFIEYEGIVNIGIDMSKIQFEEATNTIIIPKATVISIEDDENSWNEVISADRMLPFMRNEIKEADQKKAINEAQEKLSKWTSDNKVVMKQAQKLAYGLIENLVDNISKKMGTNIKFKYRLASMDES